MRFQFNFLYFVGLSIGAHLFLLFIFTQNYKKINNKPIPFSPNFYSIQLDNLNFPLKNDVSKKKTNTQSTSNKNIIQNNTIKQYYINQNSILYPEIAIDMEIEGKVTIQTEINHIGKAENIKIIKSSSFEILDKEAVYSVANWNFNSKNHTQIIKIIFELEKTKGEPL